MMVTVRAGWGQVGLMSLKTQGTDPTSESQGTVGAPMRATETPLAPNSAASARPAGPQPTTQTSTTVVAGLKGSNTDARLGCSGSVLLACTPSRGSVSALRH